ncbi:hypothetical protein JHK85_009954 [Glycine max]|nr:hypothetical protein JHK85_009954 [Glycine max]
MAATAGGNANNNPMTIMYPSWHSEGRHELQGDFKLWWTGVHDIGLKELTLDSDALELTNFALSNNTEVLVYVEKINDGRVAVSKGDVVALDGGDEGVGNEVVGVQAVVNESDSSDTESNEGGSKSGSNNDNECVIFEDSEEERATGVNDGFDSEHESLVNLISKKKCRKASHVGSSSGHWNVEEGNGELSEGYETEEL